ncbi:MAG: hypothetical protein M1833_003581 [Piccolia ochrophora]|nr:MAG: hypothetical protein M1833_003581 [Piccolia ochrophora]
MLDNRAATYEKLGNLQAALRDARRMIQLAKGGAEGYLRAAKVLHMMEKHDAALDIYEYGLRNVPKDKPHRMLLRNMHQKMSHRQCLRKPVDPLVILPIEILQIVMAQLDFRSLICKDLQYLEIGQALVGESVLEAAPFAKNLTTLLITGEESVTLDTVQRVLSICNRLSRVEFRSIVTSNIVACWPTEMPELKQFYMGAFAKDSSSLWYLNMPQLVKQAPNLVDLGLPGWNRPGAARSQLDLILLTELESINLERTLMTSFPRLPPTMRRIKMSDIYNVELSNGEGLAILRDANFTELESLDFSCTSGITGAALRLLLEPSHGTVKHLSIDHCPHISNANLCTFALEGHLRSVTELNVAGAAIDDDCAELLAAHLPRLTSLNLSSTNVTGIGVKAFVSRPKLAVLKLNHCLRVSLDAVEWARAQGTTVEFQFPDLPGRGKRVRYGE